MILTLKNFKCFKDAKFTFDEGKNILITAPSGFGKSTIFDAIKFVFWGNRDMDIVTFGKKKCEVTLEYKNYIFKRMKNPNYLSISLAKGGTVNDPKEFLETHFQQYPIKFLSQSHLKQMNILENIIFINSYNDETPSHFVRRYQDIEDLKEKLKKLISSGDKIISKYKTSIEILTSSLEKMPSPKIIEKPNLLVTISETSCSEKIKELNYNLQRYLLERSLFHEYTNELKKINIFLEQYPNYYNMNLKEITTLLEKYQKFEYEKKDLIQKINKFTHDYHQPNVLSQKSVIEKKIVSLQENIRKLDNILFSNKIVTKNINQIWNSINTKRMSIKNLEHFIENYKEIPGKYRCPHCHTELNLEKNNLVFANQCKDIERLKEIFKLYNELVDDSKIVNDLDKLKLDLKNHEEILSLIIIFDNYQNDFSQEIPILIEIITKLNIKKELQNKLETISNHSIDIINNISHEIEIYSDYLDKIKNFKQQLSIWEDNEKLRNTIISMDNEKKNNEYKLKHALHLYENILILKKHVETAQSKSMASLIKTINKELQYFMSNFFFEDIVVKLQEFKQVVSTKTLKPQIEIIIFYKGAYMKPYNLSTGELSRVELAIDLVLYKIINSNCPLLLDEVAANLDSNISSTIFNTINNYFEKKDIFIIAHQAIEGIFDFVVNEEILLKCIN